MSSFNLTDYIDEYNEIKGSLSFKPDYKKLLDRHQEQIVFCDKAVGNSHFSLVRTKEFEIVFTYTHGSKVHQCCLDMNSFSYPQDTTLRLNWGPDFCEVCWDFKPSCCDSLFL